jgi:hypothetical protein
VLLLRGSPASGCRDAGACTARLVYGVHLPAERGDAITAYGRVAPPFAPPGGEEIPEVQVEFALKQGGAKAPSPAPPPVEAPKVRRRDTLGF